MNEIKYTNDGKKVVVIGSLNSQEKIVQEIFIVNGQEVPSGENFVVKSLHDAPAKSWLSESVEKLQENREKLQTETEVMRRNFHKERRVLQEKMRYFRSVCAKEALPVFDTVAAYLNGEIKYMVSENGSIIELNEEYDGYESDLRLLAIYGRDDGTLSYKSHQYKDGSDRQSPCLLFRTLEEATEEAQRIFDERCGSYDEYRIADAKRYNLKLDEVKLAEYMEKKVQKKKKSIEELKERLLKEEAEILELES